MKKFEYNVISISEYHLESLEQKLNDYGECGWGLVCEYKGRFVFKRQLRKEVDNGLDEYGDEEY